MLKGVVTRFRAYQLGCPGSSFSYFAGGHFTVIEGRLTDVNRRTLMHEMEICGVEYADSLDITSWDSDHCNKLQELLDLVRPAEIECPGYNPYSDHGEGCLEIIADYQGRRAPRNRIPEIEHITPKYIEALDNASAVAYRNTYYNPKHIDDECANNNSTVKHFRKGTFNVLSLGDVVGDHTGDFVALNLKSNSEEISSTKSYVSKKRRLLKMNDDTLRQRYLPRQSYPR